MPLNLLKRYNDFLELNHLNERERKTSLWRIFERDIIENTHFKFQEKQIRPIKSDGRATYETLYSHLTNEKTFNKHDKNGKPIEQRTSFDFERSKRLHWIAHHIALKSQENLIIFSHKDKVRGKRKIRTYLYDKKESYVIILEPQRSETDYYLLTAYYLSKEKGGKKQIVSKIKRKLPEVH